jgi:DTW domain-containing protein YfiP
MLLAVLVTLAESLCTPSPRPQHKLARSALNRVSSPRPLCARCSRPTKQCLCASLPATPISTSTRILVLQHPAEAKKNVASVPLLPLCLEPVIIVRGQSFSETLLPFTTALEEGYEPLLLFPGEAAEQLDADSRPSFIDAERPKLLVIVDGTWTQARHMVRHSSGLAAACRQGTCPCAAIASSHARPLLC